VSLNLSFGFDDSDTCGSFIETDMDGSNSSWLFLDTESNVLLFTPSQSGDISMVNQAVYVKSDTNVWLYVIDV
jgi:hypothetical protein